MSATTAEDRFERALVLTETFCEPIFHPTVELPRPSLRLLSQAVLALAIAASAAGVVAILLRDPSPGAVEIVLPTSTPPSDVRVYVTGAVNEPGVHLVEEGARLADAVEAAGGAAPDADLVAVNLAMRVADEDHWHIPRIGEAGPPSTTVPGSADSPGGSDKVDVNSASAEELETLPQIGEVRARDIVAHRDANGPFNTIEDLIEVSGIGPRTLDTIRDLIEVR